MRKDIKDYLTYNNTYRRDNMQMFEQLKVDNKNSILDKIGKHMQLVSLKNVSP